MLKNKTEKMFQIMDEGNLLKEQMTHEQKIQHCLNHLESLGNTEKEAIELFVNLTHNATMRLPQRGWYKDDYCKLKRLEKTTAIVELKKLPFGEDILKEELKYC